MIASEEKSRLFLNAIREHLEARQKDIEDEIAAVRRQERENAEAEAAALSEEYIRLESEAIRAQANRDSAQLETALRAELAAERARITQEVFDAARKKLEAFTKTTAYRDFLLRSAADIRRHYADKPVTVYLMPADLPAREAVLALLGSDGAVEEDASILIGGCKAASPDTALRIDDTLDARLDGLKQEFYEFSGLSAQL